MWQAQGEDKAQSERCGQVPGAPLTPTAAAYLVHHLELIPEALHLLFQVLEFILLDSQQHLGHMCWAEPGPSAKATRSTPPCSLAPR